MIGRTQFHDECAVGLSKQAKTLSSRQLAHLLSFLCLTRYPVRNRAIGLLSVKAGLRAKEIAFLTWEMITEADGELSSVLRLRNDATKGDSGRIIPLNRELREVLEHLQRSGYWGGRTFADHAVAPPGARGINVGCSDLQRRRGQEKPRRRGGAGAGVAHGRGAGDERQAKR